VAEVIRYVVELRVNTFITASNILVAVPSDATSSVCDSVVMWEHMVCLFLVPQPPVGQGPIINEVL